MVDKECIRCKKIKKHYAKGYCKYCYNYINYPNKQKEYMNVWNKKNPDYFKNYYLKNKKEKNE